MSEESYIVNEGKNEIIEVDGVKYQRLAIRTHVITDKDDVCDVIEKYAKPYAKPDDIVFMTEKAVACTQRRAIPMKDVRWQNSCANSYSRPHTVSVWVSRKPWRWLCRNAALLVSCLLLLYPQSASCSTNAAGSIRSQVTKLVPSMDHVTTPCLHTTTMLYLVQQNRTKPHRRCPSAWVASRLLSPTSTTWKVRSLVSPTARWTATCWSKS